MVARGASIFADEFADELNSYTLNLFKKIQDNFGIPVSELTNILNNKRCCVVIKRKSGVKTPCKCACMPGSKYCKKHSEKLERNIELEYIELHDKEYLYDPISRKVFTFGTKSPKLVGMLSEDMSRIVI